MDDEESQDQLINKNTSQGKSRRQGSILASDDEEVDDSESGDEEDEDDLEEGDEDGSNSEEEEEEEDGAGEQDDDEEDDYEDEEDLAAGQSDPAQASGDLNSGASSDEEKENCPICLNVFRDQVVGTPENCNHYFCLDCIAEWSKNANSCPVDRITFSCIHIRAHFGGEILKKVSVLNKAEDVEEEDPTNCEVCGRSDREDRLLLCDGCDAGYHMECLTPALNAVPVDEWFCPECSAANAPQEDAEHVSEDEVANLLADVIPTTSRLRPSTTRTRAIARTRQSERVRATVNRNRITTARNIQDVPTYLTSSLLDETIETVVAGLNTAVYQRPLGPRSVAPKRRKKAGKKTGQSKGTKGTKGVGKRRRRKYRRRKSRKQTVRKTPSSHSRIARSLGLCAPSRGASLPRIQRPVEQTLGTMRQDIGATSLSVFGNANDFDPFDCYDVSNPTSPLNVKRRILSRSARRSHQPVARPISLALPRGGGAPLAHDPVAVAEPVPDLLGSILSGQSMLMMKSSDIVISRDGSLTAKKQDETTPINPSKEDDALDGLQEQGPSHSGSSTTSSSDTRKPVEQPPQLNFPSTGLYALSPAPSPPPSSPVGLERVPLSASCLPGTSAFRLKNAFTPRVVQVQSSAARLFSKHAELARFNGAFHRQEHTPSIEHFLSRKPDIKHPIKPPAKRVDISELPRIPKIKKEAGGSSHEESGKSSLPSDGTNTHSSLPRACVSQLTGRGDNHQLGKLNTTESKTKSSRQETNEQPRQSSSVSSVHSGSSSSSKNTGSSDAGGGGLRITINRSSGGSCRQFSPSSQDPFRSPDGKTQQKNTPHASSKRDKTVKTEMYDPFDPTGSDSGSPDSSPERPGPSSVPTSITIPTPTSSTPASVESNTPQSTGVKVGTFRSFRFLTHSSKIGVSKLGPDFSDMSPSSKERRLSEKGDKSPVVSPTFVKVEKEVKQEVDEEKNEMMPFKISCPLSGLKITSDLKLGGVRGFHFESKEENRVPIKTEPEKLSNRVTMSNRVVWEMESPTRSLSSPSGPNLDLLKLKTNIKEELDFSRSRSGTRSRERESGTCSHERESGTRSRERESGTRSRERESGTRSRERESGTRSRERESGTRSRERESGARSRERESGTRSRERESGTCSRERESGTRSRERESGTRSRERESGTRSRERESGTRSRERESGTCSRERESGTCSRERESGTRSRERESGTRSCERESGTRSIERESRSASWSSEEERREKSKPHKEKRARSDRSSTGSCERSKKKRQKEKKKEKKRKNSEPKERRRSRSSSHSSSSHRMYNSRKKKKKKRESRAGVKGRSVSPEKEKKRKHKAEKKHSNKEGGIRVKDKKKPKEERGKQRSKSPLATKEHKARRSKEKKHLKEQETPEESLQLSDIEEKAVTCTVTFKNELHSVEEPWKHTSLEDDDDERDPFPFLERKIVIEVPTVKQEDDVDFSSNEDADKMETNSPVWSPSLLDSEELNDKHVDSQEPPGIADSPLLNDLPCKAEVDSPQASLYSSATEPPSPEPHSPHSRQETSQTVGPPTVKPESDDLQWSPSHLDDFLLAELSDDDDDVCSVGAASPDDVDLEEAILMKREGEWKEIPLVSFSQKQAIPFLQDDGNSDEETGNHIAESTSTKRTSPARTNRALSPSTIDNKSFLSRVQSQIKRVSWNLHRKEAERVANEISPSIPLLNTEPAEEEQRPDPPHRTSASQSASSADSPNDIFSSHTWNLPDTSILDSLPQASSQVPWSSMSRPIKDSNRLPWVAKETPVQVFPQTLPLLPLPPIFPTYAPVSEPTIPCIMQSSGAMLSQTPKPGSLATANETKMQAASTGKGKSKLSLKGEKVKNEEYMKKLHMQERAVEEVKLAIKPFYQKREITKDEYKEILRKAVQKICHSRSGEINPVKVVNLVRAYVDRYKHLRKHKNADDFLFAGRESPV
uniref:PHD and ring finger domains 1 n=1 Tax=Leptobrachium leishanense TaxID=445787 RepID=A0A8C5MYL7_9ANUR